MFTGVIISYVIVAEVHPSGAVLEGTVNYNMESKTCSVSGDVNRINRYGNQSHCVHSVLLEKYCFCKDLL